MAAWAMGRLGAADRIESILPLLRDAESAGLAAAALGELRARDRAPDLVPLLRHPSAAVRGLAVEALRKIEASDSAKEVAVLLDVAFVDEAAVFDETARDWTPVPLRDLAARALLAWGLVPESVRPPSASGEAAVVQQTQAIEANSRDARAHLRRGLAQRERGLKAEARADFTVALRIGSGPERIEAVRALGALRLSDSAPEFAQALADEEALVRAEAARALGWTGSPDRARAVSALLKDPSPEVRGRAVVALGWMGSRDHVKDLLTSYRKDADRIVRSQAAWALARLDTQEVAVEIAALLKDPAPPVRAYGAEALGLLRKRAYAEEIAALLKDENPVVRGKALQALGSLGAREYAKEVEALREDAATAPFLDEETRDWVPLEIRQAAARLLTTWSSSGDK
jgi:HEAT repeat protein